MTWTITDIIEESKIKTKFYEDFLEKQEKTSLSEVLKKKRDEEQKKKDELTKLEDEIKRKIEEEELEAQRLIDEEERGPEPVHIRDFTDDEIAEINRYVSTQVPQSSLPQLVVLTNEPNKKTQAFIDIYRIMMGVSDFVANPETKEKLKRMLNQYKEAHDSLHDLFLATREDGINFGKHRTQQQLLINSEKYREEINQLCNYFLVFAEKQELISTDEFSGINLDKPEGEDIYKKLITKV
jgi:hypothetical protein